LSWSNKNSWNDPRACWMNSRVTSKYNGLGKKTGYSIG
jgi:hypothetical protein